MKTLGILGGMSWESSAVYYRLLNQAVAARRGVISPASRAEVVALIARQAARGADAVVLGCTEIGLLIDAGCSPLPCFDTTALHAAAAVDWMLEDRA
jgi:aspartate/glutamate racemase